ncbi:hypothetical protein [Sporomusa rhizae]|uniref:hypothetical protein n=1 Tax=Sporomusa rhizae TaxID=357999 RepID=UPI003529F1F9
MDKTLIQEKEQAEKLQAEVQEKIQTQVAAEDHHYRGNPGTHQQSNDNRTRSHNTGILYII